MPDRPLLLLPEAAIAARGNKGGGGGGPSKLGAGRQKERLGPRLDDLDRAFEAKAVQLQTAATGIVPEDVLVLETAGTVEAFIGAVSRIEGFEFLAEYDELDVPPDADFFTEKKGVHAAYTGRVYLVFTNQAAFRQLQRLWQVFQAGGEFEFGLTKWRDVFALLRDIRPWGVADRLDETGVLDDWNARVEQRAETVTCEIELWFRGNDQKRQAASLAVRSQILELGGVVLSEGVVPGIHYHGLAARLPIEAIRRVLDAQTRQQVRLVQSEQIQFFRAAGQMTARSSRESAPSPIAYTGPQPSGSARVALLDGLPLQNHLALAGRLLVDDPDGFEADYRAATRGHGTAMASLIVWGDLSSAERLPIPQPLYVRPIMRPVFPPAWTNMEPYECVPEGTLIVDLVHRAVRRLFERDGNVGPVAPDVIAINFSIGVRDRPFAGTLSPLARLLDWLSSLYNVLFVVSAGNHLHDVEIGKPWVELEALAASEFAALVIQSVADDMRNRRALSPAEAMNALTVAAVHDDDDTTPHAAAHVDPVPSGYPSPLNAQGPGYRRSIKPDLLVSGGRLQYDRPVVEDQTHLRLVRVAASPGVQVAAPGAVEGDVAYTAKSRGTSNAAALLTRTGALLAPVISELRQGPGGQAIAAAPDAVLVKALLAHGARWGDLGHKLHGHFESIEHTDRRTDQVTRLLGFGRLELEDLANCTTTRVTAIGAGALAADAGAEHRFPLPPSLSGKRGWRRLTVTLAWFTPVNPLSHKWRKAHLWFETPKSKLKVARVGPDWQAAQRGTLQHDTFEGEAAAAFLDGDDVVVRVSCREDAPGLQGPVPYAVAVTLETADEIDVDIYAEVRERVRQRLQVQAGTSP